MIRQCYFEDPAYVPLLLRSYELWRALEKQSGEDLLRITGVLSIGQETSTIISGTQRAAAQHNLALEKWSRREFSARHPGLRLLSDEIALLEPEGGVLDPERSVRAHLKRAQSAGADLRFQTTVSKWEPTHSGATIHLADGTVVSARKLILSLGPWFRETLGELGIALRVQRNVQVWFSPGTDAYQAGRFPPFLVDRAGLPAPLYGFPDFGHGVKAAFHGFGDLTTADELEREIDIARDVAPVARAMDDWMPNAAATLREATACMYSLTPDSHFVIDRHPNYTDVVLCGGFSGHGFKFAAVIGEIAADLALDGGSRHQIDFLSLKRFGGTTAMSSPYL
jgi:sarcosine oxidase